MPNIQTLLCNTLYWITIFNACSKVLDGLNPYDQTSGYSINTIKYSSTMNK